MLGGLVAGVAGSLMGGAFPAEHARPMRGQPLRATLIGAGAGALWGFGPFLQFRVNGCQASEVRLGLSIAGVGALAITSLV